MEQVSALGYCVVTVILGLFIHFIFLLVVAVVVGRRSPKFFVKLARPLAVAFGTASSSATLPQTMAATEEAGVSKKASQFVLPLGSTVNMDGTALYEAVAALFIAQVHGIQLGIPEQCIVILTAAMSAIGAAGIPEAGLITMVIVLNSVGLPLEGIGLLLAVDWFLDRFRTAVNVWGDAVGTTVVDRFTSDCD
jgi:Na+/H+-dicarboxylate symporter